MLKRTIVAASAALVIAAGVFGALAWKNPAAALTLGNPSPDRELIVTGEEIPHGFANAAVNGLRGFSQSATVYYNDGQTLWDGNREAEAMLGEYLASNVDYSFMQTVHTYDWGTGYFGVSLKKPEDLDSATELFKAAKEYDPNLSLDFAKDVYTALPELKKDDNAPFRREYLKYFDTDKDGKISDAEAAQNENWARFVNEGWQDIWFDQPYWEEEFDKLWEIFSEKYQAAEIVDLTDYKSSRYMRPANEDHGQIVVWENTDGRLGWAICFESEDGSKLYYRGSCFFQGVYWEAVPYTPTPETTPPPHVTTTTTTPTDETITTTVTTVGNPKDINEGIYGSDVSYVGDEQFIGTHIEDTGTNWSPVEMPTHATTSSKTTTTTAVQPAETEKPATTAKGTTKTEKATTTTTGEAVQAPTSAATQTVANTVEQHTNANTLPEGFEPPPPPSTVKVIDEPLEDDGY